MDNNKRANALIVGKYMKDAEIRALFKAGYSVTEIAKTMDLHEATVRIIINDLDVI